MGFPAQAGSAHNTSANGTLFVVATAAPLQAPAAAPRPLMTWAITNTASLSAPVRRVLVNPTMTLIAALLVVADALRVGWWSSVRVSRSESACTPCGMHRDSRRLSSCF